MPYGISPAYAAITKRCIEPVKRRHAGDPKGWVWHRFPIKGGINYREAIIRDMRAPNPLMALVKIKAMA